MPRFSSLRSGLLLTLILVLFCFETFAFAQVGSMGYPGSMGSMGSMGAMDATGVQQGAITNVSSGIKRNESSLGSVQALLYGDAVLVARVNATKIDYESLLKFVEEFVDSAGGVVRSDDKYLVQLREYQKSSAKSSFKDLLLTLQNAIVQRCYANKIDEAYFIEYKNDKGDSCSVFATPTDGLSEAEQKMALDAVHELFSPITVFKRYGFIVAVLKHEGAESVDVEAIKARYLAKMQAEQRGSAYGSYGASQGANNGANGFGGSNSNMSGVGAFGTSDSRNGVGQSANGGNSDISARLYAEYVQEVEEAKEKARASARRSVLPYIRRRFEKPADAEASAALFGALRQADGACVSCAFVDLSSFASAIEKEKKSTFDDDVAQPFSALGTDESQNSAAMLEVASNALKTDANWKSGVFALSLVGSPKLSVIVVYPDEETAKTDAQNLQASLALGQTFVQKALDDAAGKTEEKVDFTPLVSALFDSLKPQINGSNVAVFLDTAILQEHSGLFLALMGGAEKKSAVEQESEEIDWNLDDEKKADDSAAPAEVDTQQSVEEADPFAEEPEESATPSSSPNNDDDEDDPFGGDDEDPFAE